MRIAVAMLLAAGLGGCTPTRMAGFDAVAAQSDRIDVTIPAWRSGDFRLGTAGTRGHVRRNSAGRTTGQSPRFADEDYALDRIARYGSMDFTVDGPEVRGALVATCRYGRAELRESSGPFASSDPVEPLRYRCRFTRDGRAVGDLEIDAARKVDQAFVAARVGVIRFDGTELGIRSIHDIADVGVPLESPPGYLFDAVGGTVGAVEIAGGTAHLAVPRAGPGRDAAVVAGLALALFWDPGDTDD